MKATRTADHHRDGPDFIPRPHQLEARDAILSARQAGRPGFLLGDLTGLGKTLSAWLAISAMPEKDVLVICPKGAIPQWRRTIARSPDTDKRVTLMNFEKTKSLMAPPAVSTRRSTRAKNNELAKHGAPKRTWPIVVIDESHRIRNPNSQQGLVCRQIAAAADFTIYMSATAGQAPHELSYLARLLAFATGDAGGDLDAFRTLMKRLRHRPGQGALEELVVAAQRGRPQGDVRTCSTRERTPSACAAGRKTLPAGRRYSANSPRSGSMRRRAASTTPPGASSGANSGSAGGSTRKPAGWAADLRFRQKASLLRTAGTADFADDLLSNGQQVAISVAFLETSTMLLEKLQGARLVGRRDQRNAVGRRQRAGAPVLSGRRDRRRHLHRHRIRSRCTRANLPGGERERSLVVHDMRHSAIQLQQIEGRCHRDGKRAVIYYAYAEGTVEERIAATVVSRMASMEGMAGDDTRLLDEIALAVDASLENGIAE